MIVLAMDNIFTLPRRGQISPHITTLRYVLALYVLFVHIFPWYIGLDGADNYKIYNLDYSFYLFNKVLTKFFQPAYETNPAVLAFITLSGYCIHRNGLRLNHFYVTEYLKRRFFRIFPLFFIASIFSAIVFQYFDTTVSHLITATEKITWYGLLVKILGISSFFPKLNTIAYQANAPLLTVGVELWLYITYPLLLLVNRKLGNKKFLVLLMVQHMLWCIILTIKPHYINWWHNGSLFGFLIYWYIGVYFVDAELSNKMNSRTALFLKIYVCLTLVLMFLTSNIYIVELKKIIFSILLGLFLNKIDSVKNAIKEPKVSCFNLRIKLMSYIEALKESSYSLYAIHVPIVLICINLRINIFVAIGVTIIAGWLSYKLIEEPCTKLSKSYVKKKSDSLQTSAHAA